MYTTLSVWTPLIEINVGRTPKHSVLLIHLEQLIRESTHVALRPHQLLDTFDLCNATTHSRYNYGILTPIGNSEYNLVAFNYNHFTLAVSTML